MTDVIKAMGVAAFGTRLRRLSERLDREVEAIYRAEGVTFQPRWFPVIRVLHGKGEASVGELAAMIGITHAAVSQVWAELLRAGLIRARSDEADKRRQLLTLAPKGQRYAETLAPLWQAIAAATEALLADAAPKMLATIDKIEAALDSEAMVDRVARQRKTTRGKNA
ncbi:MAG TPA: MarR family transcriptional regulator [Rhizomicrobium sp.]|jgi:DNA-binding MarR family transcriptional regulator|nr:MarR family transcriptional regulator [Rhizomicrobium sp.]